MARRALLSLLGAGLILAAGCYHESDYSLPTDPATAYLTLSPSTATLPADGVSRVTITARVTSLADTSTRTITFETTAGSLVGGATATTRDVIADAAGQATVQLQSGQTTDTAIVTAKVKDVPSVLPARTIVTFLPVNPDTVVRFTSIPASAPADSATVSTIIVEVAGATNLPAASRSVMFQSTAGTFLPDNTATFTTTVDAGGMARALLRSPASPTTARVRVVFNNVVSDAFIRFDNATAEALTVTSDKFGLHANFTESAKIDVQLRRQVGIPSAGAEIVLSAIDDKGRAVGSFSSASLLSDATGHASTNFTVGTAPDASVVTITAAVKGTDVKGTTTIHILPPT